MKPQRKSPRLCTRGGLTRLLTGTSALALLVAALPAIAHADDVSKSETFGSNGKNGKAYLIGSDDPSTPGLDGGTINISNTHSSTKETTSTTSVKIGSTAGNGGHGDSAGFSSASPSSALKTAPGRPLLRECEQVVVAVAPHMRQAMPRTFSYEKGSFFTATIIGRPASCRSFHV